MSHNILLITSGFLLDFILLNLFPYDYSMYRMSFVSSAGLVALMLVVKKMKFLDGVLMSFLTGLIFCLFMTDETILYAVIFSALSILVYLWAVNMSDSRVELVLMLLSLIFIKELVVFFWFVDGSFDFMLIMIWMQRVLFLTIIGNVPAIIILIYFDNIKNDIAKKSAQKRKKEEDLFWKKYN